MVRPLLLLLLSSFFLPAPASPAERAWIDVTVRVYDATPTATLDRARALAITAAVLEPAELAIQFRQCDALTPEPACGQPLGPNQVVLRLVRGATPRPWLVAQVPLGDALVDRHRRAGALATVYVERVEWLAQQSRADAAVLLGRAIAHELVHVLSGRSTHAPRGLMRAVWLAREVADDRAEDWRLQDAEKRLLRSRRRPADVQAALR